MNVEDLLQDDKGEYTNKPKVKNSKHDDDGESCGNEGCDCGGGTFHQDLYGISNKDGEMLGRMFTEEVGKSTGWDDARERFYAVTDGSQNQKDFANYVLGFLRGQHLVVAMMSEHPIGGMMVGGLIEGLESNGYGFPSGRDEESVDPI